MNIRGKILKISEKEKAAVVAPSLFVIRFLCLSEVYPLARAVAIIIDILAAVVLVNLGISRILEGIHAISIKPAPFFCCSKNSTCG